MKKGSLKMKVISILVTSLIIFILGACGWHETHYTLLGIVTEVNEYDKTVVVTDLSGEAWECYATGFKVNDRVKMTMDTCCTYDIYDDEIDDIQVF